MSRRVYVCLHLSTFAGSDVPKCPTFRSRWDIAPPEWLTITHTRRWKEHYHEVGHGHLYQGRFKSFPVQDDAHFLTVARYVERNSLRANLVSRAEDWLWSSLWRRAGRGVGPARPPLPLANWPVEQPIDWLACVNAPQTPAELEALRDSVNKGKPFGEKKWQASVTAALGLESSYRKAGRPKRG